MSHKGKFIKGAAILAMAGIVIKLLGAVFRIPLTNWIGADGMATGRKPKPMRAMPATSTDKYLVRMISIAIKNATVTSLTVLLFLDIKITPFIISV